MKWVWTGWVDNRCFVSFEATEKDEHWNERISTRMMSLLYVQHWNKYNKVWLEFIICFNILNLNLPKFYLSKCIFAILVGPLKTCCNISTLAQSLRSFVYIFSIRIAIKRCKMLLNDDEITIIFFFLHFRGVKNTLPHTTCNDLYEVISKKRLKSI